MAPRPIFCVIRPSARNFCAIGFACPGLQYMMSRIRNMVASSVGAPLDSYVERRFWQVRGRTSTCATLSRLGPRSSLYGVHLSLGRPPLFARADVRQDGA